MFDVDFLNKMLVANLYLIQSNINISFES